MDHDTTETGTQPEVDGQLTLPLDLDTADTDTDGQATHGQNANG